MTDSSATTQPLLLGIPKIALSAYRLKQVLVVGAVIGSLGVVLAAQRPAPPPEAPYVSLVTAPKLDLSPAARAERAAARLQRDNVQWSALTAARREPQSVLKGIELTAVERRATRAIVERFLDRSERMNRDDKNAYRAATDTSTMLPSIAALRLEQREALRAALSRAKWPQFDANVAKLVARERAA